MKASTPHGARSSAATPHNVLDRFGFVLAVVTENALLELAQRLLALDDSIDWGPNPQLSVGEYNYGAFHILFPILVDGISKWLIKVPRNGVAGKWDAKSAEAMVSEALTMAYIYHTSRNQPGLRELPIPRVVAYSDTVTNSLSCAYIAISYIDGLPLHSVWYGHRLSPDKFDAATAPKRRSRTLEGLAEVQAQLGQYSYPRGGMLRFAPYPTVDGHTFVVGSPPPRLVEVGAARLPDQEEMLRVAVQANKPASSPANSGDKNRDSANKTNRQPKLLPLMLHRLLAARKGHGIAGASMLRGRSTWLGTGGHADVDEDRGLVSRIHSVPHQESGSMDGNTSSTTETDVIYYTWGPLSDTHAYFTRPLDLHPPTHPYQKGVHKLLRLLISWIPDTPSSETVNDRFVLAHPDLNMQNIIVAEDGTLLGLIDWDNVSAVPRALGNECYPSFLTRDWDPNVYSWVPAMEDDGYVLDPDSSLMWEDSPQSLREQRVLYLQMLSEMQKKTSPFTAFYRDLCQQSVVVENIFLAAYDPMSRIQIIQKVVSESWKAYEKSTGRDLTHLSSYKLYDLINNGEIEGSVLVELEKAFHELLKSVDG
ncbi:serine threonine protein kinase [Ophiostoma piceae UAMH 11346]|uniref:Serine threonine protein kinase n=1 Tax=Ophiostoma piceae (strain UAMH 11346) TaxID=1262450 RepID=S3C4F8_OPHP1|nr:serine threonine protein kinase [Ophiostoma piceae UAMH 11346]